MAKNPVTVKLDPATRVEIVPGGGGLAIAFITKSGIRAPFCPWKHYPNSPRHFSKKLRICPTTSGRNFLLSLFQLLGLELHRSRIKKTKRICS